MKKVILLSIILIFLITGIGFAFQNEPDGFRGLKWGDAPTEDMKFFIENLDGIDKGYEYTRPNENNYIGSVEISSVYYYFNLRNNQFYKMSTGFGKKYLCVFTAIFKDRFGEPTKEEKYLNGYGIIWDGEITLIRMFYNTDVDYGFVTFESKKVKPEEPPEIDIEIERDKAKEDF